MIYAIALIDSHVMGLCVSLLGITKWWSRVTYAAYCIHCPLYYPHSSLCRPLPPTSGHTKCRMENRQAIFRDNVRFRHMAGGSFAHNV